MLENTSLRCVLCLWSNICAVRGQPLSIGNVLARRSPIQTLSYAGCHFPRFTNGDSFFISYETGYKMHAGRAPALLCAADSIGLFS